jgi:hypothetical protein
MQGRWSDFFLHRWQIEIMHETGQLKKRIEEFEREPESPSNESRDTSYKVVHSKINNFFS